MMPLIQPLTIPEAPQTEYAKEQAIFAERFADIERRNRPSLRARVARFWQVFRRTAGRSRASDRGARPARGHCAGTAEASGTASGQAV
ncbi:MAG: hypothetical protein AAGA05_06895 [Pseudomonadota bacterium]